MQDLYVKELKAYKAPPQVSAFRLSPWTNAHATQAKDAHVGVVKQYTLPPTPKPPVVPADLASELSAYDAVEPVEVSANAATGSSEPSTTGADTFLTFLEADEPKAESHH